MNLLGSEFQPLDAVLEHAVIWANDLECAMALWSAEPDDVDVLEEPPAGRWATWYQPRLTALRSLLGGS